MTSGREFSFPSVKLFIPFAENEFGIALVATNPHNQEITVYLLDSKTDETTQ